ncbi:MAG: beta-L-arabinofuranosidase domain-containing protein [Ruminococcus sp.]
MLTDTTRSPYAKVHALDGMKVKWTGGLWKERFDTCANSTVPQLKHMFDSKDISHVVENFKICAGDAEGDFDGTVFGDGDFYKWMESAIYTAYQTDNQLLKKEIENYIDLDRQSTAAWMVIFPQSRSSGREPGTASQEWAISMILRFIISVICLQQRVCTRELPERIISLQ